MQEFISDPYSRNPPESNTRLESFLADFGDNIEDYIPDGYALKEGILRFQEWLIGKNGESPDIIQSRRQAVKSYPLLGYYMWKYEDIRNTIESKKPLTPTLARLFKVEEKIFKRVQGKKKSDLGNIHYNDLHAIFYMKENHFQHLKNNLPDLNILREYASSVYYMSIHEFLDYPSSQGGNLHQQIKRMKENSVYDVRDGFEFLRTRLFLPALLNRIKTHAEKNNLIFYNHHERKASRDAIIKYTNFKTILDFSERYHRNLFRWEDMFNFYSGMKHISWQPMFGEIDLGSGWMAREIHSVKELKEQGRRENHCVGGYAGSILKRNNSSTRLIFSLEKAGEVKSTIDMLCSKNEEKNGLDATIQQNRAHSNKDPDAEALNFSHHLVEIIKKQPISKLNTYLDGLKNAREEYQKYQTDNKYVAKCGYNPWDRDILENVWDEFKPILPVKLRRLGLDGLIDRTPLENVKFHPRENSDQLNPWDEIKNEKATQIENDEVDAEMGI